MIETLRAAPVPVVASKRIRALAVLTRIGVGAVSGRIGTGAGGVRLARWMIASLMRSFGSMPAGTGVKAVDEGPTRGEWVCGPGVRRESAQVIYFLHGSAYMMCSPATHRSFAARLSQVTGLPAFVLDYRLAPEHSFPAAADDVDAGWNWLVAQGYSPSDIVVAGDSAGGHLAAALVLNRASAGQSPPACTVLFSPVADVTFALSAQQERIRRDPMITAAKARRLVGLYTADADLTDVRLTLDYGGAADCSPILVQAGGAEMLQADARHLAARVTEGGGDVTLEVWPGQMHVFQALPRLGPEPDAALRRVRDFVVDAFELTRTVGEAAS